MNTHDETLPELSDARIAELEAQLFEAIAADPTRPGDADRRRRARRGRIWLAGGAAAAVIVVAAVIAPYVSGITSTTAGSAADQSAGSPEFAPNAAPDIGDGGAIAEDSDGRSLPGSDELGGSGDREIVATASASVEVDDITRATEQITAIADDAGGYVEALSLGADGRIVPQEMYDSGTSLPYPQTNAWVSLRVPAAQLDAVLAALTDVGEVTSSQLDRRDVTSEAVDLRARIDALRTSVERLESLMADATSTSDLLAAESALAERQAQLESYEQQLKHLEDQVGMSSLTVSLYEPGEVVKADPAGFGDGIAAGWNGLVATLNGIVIALGFLLPWLGVIALIGLVVWLSRRAVRRRAAARAASPEDGD